MAILPLVLENMTYTIKLWIAAGLDEMGLFELLDIQKYMFQFEGWGHNYII
jgi:hypothetical protein